MNCPKCNFPIQSNDKFCQGCGNKIVTMKEHSQNRDNFMDEELVNAYIGRNADKIRNKHFSFCTLLFGPFYIFYRKMWLYGVLWI